MEIQLFITLAILSDGPVHRHACLLRPGLRGCFADPALPVPQPIGPIRQHRLQPGDEHQPDDRPALHLHGRDPVPIGDRRGHVHGHEQVAAPGEGGPGHQRHPGVGDLCGPLRLQPRHGRHHRQNLDQGDDRAGISRRVHDGDRRRRGYAGHHDSPEPRHGDLRDPDGNLHRQALHRRDPAGPLDRRHHDRLYPHPRDG